MKRLLVLLVILGLFLPTSALGVKWSDLSELTTVASGDFTAIVDVSETPDETKKITWGSLMAAPGDFGGTTPGAGAVTTLTGTGVMTVSPDGTNEVLQVNDGTVDFTDGNAGTTGTLTVDASGHWSYNKNIVSTGNVAGATYGSDASISDAELLTLDNGATTEVLVGGGAGSAPVWTTTTGTGAPVRSGTPTLVTPVLGAATGTSVAVTGKVTGTNVAEYAIIYIDAGAMVPCTTNGAASGTNEYGTNDIEWDYFAFDGGATEERVQFKIVMPENWDRADDTMKAKFYWSSATSSTANDTVEWGIKAGALANSVAIDTALGTAVTISDTLLANNGADLQISAATAVIVVAQAQALGDMLTFEIYRNTDGTDDMAEDAWLFGCAIQYKKDNTVSAW